MANVNTVNYAKELAGTMPKDFRGAEWRGKVKVLVDTYTAAALAIAQTIGVGKLRKDSLLVDALINFVALGASSTLSLGDAGSATKYMAAFATSSAGNARLINSPTATQGIGVKMTADTELILTVAGGTITGLIQTAIFYADQS